MRKLKMVTALIIVLMLVCIMMFACTPDESAGGGDGDKPEQPTECKHEFGDWVVTKEATCLDKGTREQVCILCKKEKKEEEIPALGHDYVDDVCIRCGDKCTQDLILKDNGGKSYTVMGVKDTSKANLYIPDTYNGKPITKIDKEAFKDNTSLENVEIGNNVKTILLMAFYNCSNLKSVKIGSGLQLIDLGTFGACTSLEKIVIPDNVTTMHGSVFTDCTMLREVTLSGSITEISDGMFYGCTSLTKVNIPSNITKIGNQSFMLCTSLEEINIPDSVTEVGGTAFLDCTSLNNVIGAKKVKIVGHRAFEGCTSLTSFDAESIEEIGEAAFNDCRELTSVNLSDKVTAIPDQTFKNCRKLRNVDLPQNLVSIGTEAFMYCQAIESIHVPISLTTVGQDAFFGLINLKKIYAEDLMSWLNIDFGNAKANPLNGSRFPREDVPVEEIGGELYTELIINDTIVQDLVIPEGVEEIKQYAFNQCGSIKSVKLPSTIKTIGMGALDMYTLQVIDFPDIETFMNCKFGAFWLYVDVPKESGNQLYIGGQPCENLIIPENVTVIRSYQLWGIRNVKTITMHKNITLIRLQAFAYSDYNKIVFEGTKDEFLAIERNGDWGGAYWYFTVECIDGTLTRDEVIES